MKKIRKLSEETINKIAAGEVIDRPSSVVKELVENSLDAGSTRVSVSVEDAGLSLIEVADNGSGMDPEDLRQSLLRHTTSKIRGAGDLSSINSFGFRGEALASIAAVSKMEIRSIPEESDRGIELSVSGGEIRGERPVSGNSGTVVKVKELFFNTPARKKFLRSRKVEQGNVKNVFWDLAIPCRGVYFHFNADGKESLSVPADLDIRERVHLREGEIAALFHEFKEVSPYFSLEGLVTSPLRTFPRSNRMSIFVNNRAVRDGIGVGAVKEGLRGLIPENRYPSAYIFIEVSPEEADVNVHPSKREVRFRYRRELFEIISYAVKRCFVREGSGSGADSARPPGEADFWVPTEEADLAGPWKGMPRQGRTCAADSSHPSGEKGRETPHDLFEARKPLSKMRILGQVLGNYVLLDGGEELFFCDIHAASERVQYWRVRKGFSNWLERPEHLLISVTVPIEGLSGHADRVKEVLVNAGYRVELEEGVMRVVAVPLYLKGIDPALVVEDLLEILEGDFPGGAMETEKAFEELIAKIACHSSVRGTRILPEEEVRYLLEELEKADYSETCPHGRPVYVRISRRELHKLFGRT